MASRHGTPGSASISGMLGSGRFSRDNTYQVANTLERVGHTFRAIGRHEHARAAWQEALELCRAQHRTAEAEQLRRHLAAPRPG